VRAPKALIFAPKRCGLCRDKLRRHKEKQGSLGFLLGSHAGIVVLTNLSNDDVVSGGAGLCEQVLREYAKLL
jgi:hypothetical protein